jgi:hypothetical protein
MFRFVVDTIKRGRAYPNLARHPAEPYGQTWREFGQHSPYTVPFELINHCEQHGYPFELTSTGEYLDNTTDNNSELYYYPVQFGFFSFETDYVLL